MFYFSESVGARKFCSQFLIEATEFFIIYDREAERKMKDEVRFYSIVRSNANRCRKHTWCFNETQ